MKVALFVGDAMMFLELSFEKHSSNGFRDRGEKYFVRARHYRLFATKFTTIVTHDFAMFCVIIHGMEAERRKNSSFSIASDLLVY